MIKTRQTCRICGHPLKSILSLGDCYLPQYLTPNDTPAVTRRIPLDLMRCDVENHESACGLVQLRHTTPPSLLYNKYYYMSGINESMTRHLQDIVEYAAKNYISISPPNILDIGCNDGTLLAHWKKLGFEVLTGFDPARNLCNIAADKVAGSTIINGCFDKKRLWSNAMFNVITSIAMFYDLEYPNDFVRDISRCLSPGGVWITEQSYLPAMLKQNSFDTICQEHLEYYSFAVMERLLGDHNLEVIDVFLNEVNGGSFQVHISHKNVLDISDAAYERIESLRIGEFNMGLDTPDPYNSFKYRIQKNGEDLINFLKSELSRGKRIVAYGASTKGSVTLQYWNINNVLIEACADRNPDKWGTRMIGSDIPIISEEEARKMKPDYFLVLPWHFIDGFIQRESEFLNRGGKFVVPMPEFRVIRK